MSRHESTYDGGGGGGGGGGGLESAALRALMRGVVGAESSEAEQQRLVALRGGIHDAVAQLAEAVRRLGPDAPLQQIVNRTTGAICEPVMHELQAAGDAALRLRRAENEMQFMANQIRRREELAAAQRTELLRQLSVGQERLFSSRTETQKAVTATRAKQQQLQAAASFNNFGADGTARLGSFMQGGGSSGNVVAVADQRSSSPSMQLALTQSVVFSSPDVVANASSPRGGLGQPSLEVVGDGGEEDGSHQGPPPMDLATAAADVRILSTRLDAEWDKLAADESVGAREEQLARENDKKLKEQAARMRHEQGVLLQRQARQLETTLRSETLKLSARVRQLEHQLRRKETEVESSLSKERAKWAGANSKSEAAAESQIRRERLKHFQAFERLAMQLHDERTLYGTTIDSLTLKLHHTHAHTAQLKEELAAMTKAKERATQLIAAGNPGSPTSASKAAAQESARKQYQLNEQLRHMEAELAESRRAATDAAEQRALSASVAGMSEGLPSPSRGVPPAMDASLIRPLSSASPHYGSSHGGGSAFDAAAAGSGAGISYAFDGAASTNYNTAASGGGKDINARFEIAALEARVADLVGAREALTAEHQEALGCAASEADELRALLGAAEQRIAALEAAIADGRADAANHRTTMALLQQQNAEGRSPDQRRRSSSVRGAQRRSRRRSTSSDHGFDESSAAVTPAATSPTPTTRERELVALVSGLADRVERSMSPAQGVAGSSAVGIDGVDTAELERIVAVELEKMLRARGGAPHHAGGGKSASRPSSASKKASSSGVAAGSSSRSSNAAAHTKGGGNDSSSSLSHSLAARAVAMVTSAVSSASDSSRTTTPHGGADQRRGSASGRPPSARSSAARTPAPPAPSNGVHERSQAMMAKAAAKRDQLAAEARERTSRVCQLSTFSASNANPAFGDDAAAVLDATREAREDGRAPTRGAVWVEMAEVVARAQRLLADGPMTALRGLAASEQHTSAARAALHHAIHDVRFARRSAGTQTDDVVVCELPHGFSFGLDCYQQPHATASTSTTTSTTTGTATATHAAAAGDTEYLLFVCNPLRQLLTVASAALVSPPFVYDASDHFVPSQRDHVERLTSFADHAMASIVSMLNRPGNQIRAVTAKQPRGDITRSSPQRHDASASPPRTTTTAESEQHRTRRRTNAAGEVDSVTKETLQMVYRHRDGRRPLVPRPPSCGGAVTDGAAAAEADAAAAASDALSRAVASTLASDATAKAILAASVGQAIPMSMSSRSRPTSARVRASTTSGGGGSSPSPPGSARNAAHSGAVDQDRYTQPHVSREATYHPMMMTHQPARLADRNNPYSTLRGLQSGRSLAPGESA